MLPAMALAAIPAAVQSVAGIAQGIAGIIGNKKNKRPEYQIPDEFNSQLNTANNVMGLGGMNRDAYMRGLQNIARNQNMMMTNIRGRGGAIAGASAALRRSNDAALSLSAEDSRMQRNNYLTGASMRMNALNRMAEQRLNKQNWDKLSVFKEKQAMNQALLGAGMQNFMGGLNTMSTLATADMAYNEGKGLAQLFPKAGKK